jgi:6-phosphofructokinase 1
MVAYLMRSGAPDSLDRMVAMDTALWRYNLFSAAKPKNGRSSRRKVYNVPIENILAAKKQVDVPNLYDWKIIVQGKRFPWDANVLS